MIHKRMLGLGVLLCMSISALCAEPPISPWQSLTPTLGEASQFEVAVHNEPEETVVEEYNDAPYDISYDVTSDNYTEEYLTQEELLLQRLPFKIPFKMDKKQLAVSIKLLKEAIKPILKSKTLHDVVAYIDDSLLSYRSDIDTQLYLTLLLDSMQELYEGKETSELNMMVKRVFTDMSDEETARTLGSIWNSITPTLYSYVYNPMRNYVISPVRSYLVDPVSEYVTDISDRIGGWMSGTRTPYINIQYPEAYGTWSERVNSYASRISDWASQARQGLEMARRMLEVQEEARSCHGCSSGIQETEQEFYSVQ